MMGMVAVDSMKSQSNWTPSLRVEREHWMKEEGVKGSIASSTIWEVMEGWRDWGGFGQDATIRTTVRDDWNGSNGWNDWNDWIGLNGLDHWNWSDDSEWKGIVHSVHFGNWWDTVHFECVRPE